MNGILSVVKGDGGRVRSGGERYLRCVKGERLRHEVLTLIASGALCPLRSHGSADVSGAATARSASASNSGNFFPRFAALRRIPAHAFGLKKNLGGTVRASSRMSDKEDSTTSLGHSEILSVQHSVGEPIPELNHRPEDGAKVPPSSRRQDAGDVFPDNPPRTNGSGETKKLERKTSSLVRESATETGETEALAGSTSDEKVN